MTGKEANASAMPEFRNRRFDPVLNPIQHAAEAMAKAVGYTAALSIDRQLAQLLRLRVAQLNPCAYCLILHDAAASDQGISQPRRAGLASWRESGLYSDGERLALAYCEELTRFDEAGVATAHDALTAEFSEPEIAEIAAVVINMNVWTRLKLAQGATPFAKTVGLAQ